jgi:hypothetical protein
MITCLFHLPVEGESQIREATLWFLSHTLSSHSSDTISTPILEGEAGCKIRMKSPFPDFGKSYEDRRK